jgi:putative transposase
MLPSRRTPRLPGFDYARPGIYFVSTCTHRRRCVLGRVVDGKVYLSKLGRIVEEEWLLTAERWPYVMLDSYVIMPNHVHGLIVIQEHPDSGPARSRRKSLSSIVGAFKAAASRRVAALDGRQGRVLWQRSYHERVVRNYQELNRIRAYIAANPARWHWGDARVAPTRIGVFAASSF